MDLLNVSHLLNPYSMLVKGVFANFALLVVFSIFRMLQTAVELPYTSVDFKRMLFSVKFRLFDHF